MGKIYFIILYFLSLIISGINADAQDIPEDELQARINTYFDNFGVTVFYPSINYSKKLSKNTSISASYLTDIISSASMRSLFEVDGITSATSRTTGGSDNTPDEWRHEVGLGIIQKISEGSLSLNGLYSTEHDYSSKTFIGAVTYPFAQKNAYLTLSAVASFDKIFPQNRTWTKDRTTYTYSAAFSQILSKNIIAQIDASYIGVSGYQLTGYQIVRIYNVEAGRFINYEPVYPDSRVRRAVGVRANIGLTAKITLQPGYRYYWDSWNIHSSTVYAKLSKNFSDVFSGSLEYRQYNQTSAFFFKPYYDSLQEFMGVDGQLNSGYSNNIEVNMTLKGKRSNNFLSNEKIQLIGTVGYYKRHYDSPDWHSGYLNLYALLISLGFRYIL